MTKKDIITIEDVINNLKGSTNIEIQAQDLSTAEHLTVFKGTVKEYKQRFHETAIDLMSIKIALFTNENTVIIAFNISISILKEALKTY